MKILSLFPEQVENGYWERREKVNNNDHNNERISFLCTFASIQINAVLSVSFPFSSITYCCCRWWRWHALCQYTKWFPCGNHIEPHAIFYSKLHIHSWNPYVFRERWVLIFVLCAFRLFSFYSFISGSFQEKKYPKNIEYYVVTWQSEMERYSWRICQNG